jgi:hypothetical protein
MQSLSLICLNGSFAVSKLKSDAKIPDWASATDFISVTRTEDELSIICPEDDVPTSVECERGWRCIKVAGPLEFSLVGVMASVLNPLKEAKLSIFAISTYDTDYVLVKIENFEKALEALVKAGHNLIR